MIPEVFLVWQSYLVSAYDYEVLLQFINISHLATLKTPYQNKKTTWQENLGIVEPLEFFHQLNRKENNLLQLLNKRNDK